MMKKFYNRRSCCWQLFLRIFVLNAAVVKLVPISNALPGLLAILVPRLFVCCFSQSFKKYPVVLQPLLVLSETILSFCYFTQTTFSFK